MRRSRRSVHSASPQASMGLETMLFGVSGSCDDMDATSLPVELEPGPPSEKLTCGDMKQRSGAWTEQSRGGEPRRRRAAAASRLDCPVQMEIKLLLFGSSQNIDIGWMESA